MNRYVRKGFQLTAIVSCQRDHFTAFRSGIFHSFENILRIPAARYGDDMSPDLRRPSIWHLGICRHKKQSFDIADTTAIFIGKAHEFEFHIMMHGYAFVEIATRNGMQLLALPPVPLCISRLLLISSIIASSPSPISNRSMYPGAPERMLKYSSISLPLDQIVHLSTCRRI